MTKNRIAIPLLCAALLILPFMASLHAWEPAIKIALDGLEVRYGKPLIKVGPDGMIYMCYKYRNAILNETDIHIKTYDGSKLDVLGNVNISQNPKSASYEQDFDVNEDGKVHVVWNEYYAKAGVNTQHHLMYRVWDGLKWSTTRTLATFGCDHVEDVRMAVSPNGNVHVAWMTWPDSNCHVVSLYPEGINKKGVPLRGRSKHPDIVADDNSVHIIWQYRPTGVKYGLAYAKMDNKYNSTWSVSKDNIARLTHDVARPRMTIDEDSKLHIVYNQENQGGSPSRRLIYFSGTSSTFSDNNTNTISLFDPAFRLYHYHDIFVANGSIIASIQDGPSAGGGRLYYDWKKTDSSKFPGMSSIPYVNSPKLQAIALSPDGSTAYSCYMTNESSISLITSGPVVLKPVARGKVDVTMSAIDRTVLRTLLFSKVRYQVSWTYLNEDDLATLTAIELHRSPKDQNTYTLLKTLGVNEGTYTDDGEIGSADTYYDYMVRILWNDTLDQPHYSDSLGNTGLIEEEETSARQTTRPIELR